MKADSKGRAAAGKPEHLGDLKDELAPGLYVTSTPIGNARDITLRALDVLKGVDLIVAEDTRVTAKLLAIYGISKPLTAYNDHNAARERPRLLGRLRGGARIALVSDAGTPLVSDPGFKLVREAIQERLPVHAVPGASAALTGLVLSGLPSDRFLFAGFLPQKQAARAAAVAELAAIRASLVFYESANRTAATLAALAEGLGNRPAAVAREISKRFEETVDGDLATLAERYAAEPPRGEVVIVVGPPVPAAAPGPEEIDRLLADAMATQSLKDAVADVTRATGLKRADIYARALALRDGTA